MGAVHITIVVKRTGFRSAAFVAKCHKPCTATTCLLPRSLGQQRELSAKFMQKIMVQLKRLQRHYDISVKSYDDASLLDLAHVLRIWVELKSVLPDKYNSVVIKKPFRSGSPSKKLSRGVKDCQYVLSFLPKNGVITYASNGNMAESPDLNGGGDFSMGVGAKVMADCVEFHSYYYASKSLDSVVIKAVNTPKIIRCNYSEWMGAEAVRLQFKNKDGVMEKVSLSREVVIKRVANVFLITTQRKLS